MAKAKKHIWQKDKTIAGVEYCTRCSMTKIKIKGNLNKTIFYRKGGIIDNSRTKHNCFKLSVV